MPTESAARQRLHTCPRCGQRVTPSELVECGKCRRSFTVDEFFDHNCPAKDSTDD